MAKVPVRAKLLGRVKKTLRQYALLKPKDRVLVAYSGGMDSTALLHMLLDIRDELSLELFLGHFNHKMRLGADRDELFVRQVAKECSLPLFVGTEEVRSFSRSQRLNLEEAARKLRYGFLQETAQELGASRIATGHTLNDQAETFFMRLMRGSGLLGLSSIFPSVEGILIRPLIQVKREEIASFLEEEGIDFCVDETNEDRRYLRNRIRKDLIPFIQKNFEPDIVSRVGRLVSIIQQEESLLEELGRKEAEKAIASKEGKSFLDSVSLSSLPLSLSRRVVRDFLAKVKGNLREISFGDVESVLELDEDKEFSLKKDLILRKEKGFVFVRGKRPPKTPYEYKWEGVSPLEIREISKRFEGEIRKAESKAFPFDDSQRAFLDRGKLRFPLCVRNRREGDRYQPMGGPGRKKLKEIMRAKGIPLHERDRNPVFLSAGEIAWVLGLPVSEKYRITASTQEVFVIQKK